MRISNATPGAAAPPPTPAAGSASDAATTGNGGIGADADASLSSSSSSSSSSVVSRPAFVVRQRSVPSPSPPAPPTSSPALSPRQQPPPSPAASAGMMGGGGGGGLGEVLGSFFLGPHSFHSPPAEQGAALLAPFGNVVPGGSVELGAVAGSRRVRKESDYEFAVSGPGTAAAASDDVIIAGAPPPTVSATVVADDETVRRRGAPQALSREHRRMESVSLAETDVSLSDVEYDYDEESLYPLIDASAHGLGPQGGGGLGLDNPYKKGRNGAAAGPQSASPWIFAPRSREQAVIHFLMELRMLRSDWAFTLFGILYQLFHSVMTNLAYYYHAKLSAANRVPLSDIFFDLLPAVNGSWWMASEFILYGMIVLTVVPIVSVLAVRWYAPHGRPLYCMHIVRRMLMTLVACQTLRIVSFMVTTLPGASRQCLYHVPEHLTAKEMVEDVADPSGNPSGWKPPETLYDIIFRVDATNGCGDLMFSSHTIFTVLFVCIVFKYFSFPVLKRTMLLLQIVIVPFILASHKHYSVDVFTALYVTPLVFEMLWIRFPDRDTSTELSRHYGIRFYLAPAGDGFAHVVGMWGREFYVEPDDLPVDLNPRFRSLRGTRQDGAKGGAAPSSLSRQRSTGVSKPLTRDINGDVVLPSEVSPMIV